MLNFIVLLFEFVEIIYILYIFLIRFWICRNTVLEEERCWLITWRKVARRIAGFI